MPMRGVSVRAQDELRARCLGLQIFQERRLYQLWQHDRSGLGHKYRQVRKASSADMGTCVSDHYTQPNRSSTQKPHAFCNDPNTLHPNPSDISKSYDANHAESNQPRRGLP